MTNPEDQPKKGPKLAANVADLTPEERAAFERRLDDLDTKLDGVQARRKAEADAQQDKILHSRGMAYGLRMSSELVAAIVVGGLIGYVLDKWLETGPWLFLLFFFLGFAAGILNVTRAFNRMQAEITERTGGDIGHAIKDDDED
jgi:ATP synthase protein I